MKATKTFGSLFEREPKQWGFRGDPHLWRELGELYAETPMPDSWFATNRLLADGFQQLTGHALDAHEDEAVRVARYRIGSGMSDGAVSIRWWATIGQALLADRWAAQQHSS